MPDILMPALSPTMEEGTLSKWHVKPGDSVKSGDVIADIETDKATMEVEAVDEGEIGELLVEEGAQGVKVGTPIAKMAGEGGEAGASAEPPPAPAPQTAGDQKAEPAAAPHEGENRSAAEASQPDYGSPPAEPTDAPDGDAMPLAPSVRRIATEAHLDLSTVKGTGKDGRITKGDALEASAPQDGDRVTASPYARKLAAEKNVDLAAMKGSGPGGRIIERDVVQAQAAPKPAAAPTPAPAPSKTEPVKAAAAASPPAAAPSLEQLGIPAGSYDLQPLDGMRRTIAKRLTEAARDIPSFPLTIDLEIDDLLATRKTINELLN
ncbi:MAG: hypothetical protein EON88_15915, partial [Brevundimonas sp.]